jgi:hypothetical protein
MSKRRPSEVTVLPVHVEDRGGPGGERFDGPTNS